VRIRSVFSHSTQAIAEGALISLLVVGLMAGTAFAASGGKGGAGSCTRNTPGVAVDNSWSWSGWGSWGLPGQKLTYAVHVINYDVGCRSSSFAVTVSAPDGFSVSLPTNTVSLKSSGSAYLWASVTSPSSAADGDYPINVSVVRANTSSPSGSFTSSYKVYSSDTVAPTLFWQNPGDGTTISGRTYTMVVSSKDDHAVKKIDLYIDNGLTSTTACDDISDICQLDYNWSTVGGQHTATFKSYDWMGNVGVLTVSFTVN
jgi:hypothetical protein